MERKALDLANLFLRRQIGRRELMRKAGQLGIGAAAANYYLAQAATSAMAADFDWQKHKGKTIGLLKCLDRDLDAVTVGVCLDHRPYAPRPSVSARDSEVVLQRRQMD